MRYLSLPEVLELHARILAATGGAAGVRDLSALESAVNQPRATFGSEDLYPDLASKAATLCHSLILNHPFVDGNKRAGHAAMETFLMLNGYEVDSEVGEQERLFLDLASGKISREALTHWLQSRLRVL